jgi:hypothetical protein
VIDLLRRLWNRPIRDEERIPLFLACALLLVGAAALLALTSDRAPRPSAERAKLGSPSDGSPPAAPVPVIARRPAEARAATPSFKAQRRAVRRAERVARRFLAGYLPYSYGRGRMSAVGSSASPALRAELAARPPRVPARVRRLNPRISALQAEATGADSIAFVALIDDGARSYGLTLALEPAGRTWQVTGLGG